MIASWQESDDKPRQYIKKQRHHFAYTGLSSQCYGFSSCHVQMWELDHKEGWAGRTNAFELWCWRRLLRVPWTARRSNQSILKEINPWIFIGRTDDEAEAPIFWPPDAKRQLTGKDLDVGKDWGQEEKGVTEDEMVGWHHWLDGPEFKQISGDGEWQKDWCAAVHGVLKSKTRLSDWTTPKFLKKY